MSHVYYTQQDICNFFIATKYFPKEIVLLIFIGFYQLILYVYFYSKIKRNPLNTCLCKGGRSQYLVGIKKFRIGSYFCIMYTLQQNNIILNCRGVHGSGWEDFLTQPTMVGQKKFNPIQPTWVGLGWTIFLLLLLLNWAEKNVKMKLCFSPTLLVCLETFLFNLNIIKSWGVCFLKNI